MAHIFKDVSWLALLSLLGILLNACDNIDWLHSDRATVQFYNQLTAMGKNEEDAITVDVFRANRSTALLQNQAYSQADDSIPIGISLGSDPDDVNLTLRRTDNDDEVVSARLSFRQNERYSLIAMGDVLAGTSALLAYRQQPLSLAHSRIKLRFIHTASQLVNSLNVLYNNEQLLAEELLFKDASSYVTLSDVGDLLTVDILQDEVFLETVSCAVKGGRTYDMFIAYTNFNHPFNLSLFCHEIS